MLGGFGDAGTTNIPPILSDWHVEPTTPRTFDIDAREAEARGRRATRSTRDGKRLDKEGNPIALRVIYPNTNDHLLRSRPSSCRSGTAQLGIDVSLQSLDSDTVTNRVLPPEGDPPGKADYDIEIWGWSGSPDPSYLLSIFRCDEIGISSDSQYCNPAYDALYEQQLTQAGAERKATLAEMQNLIYDEAPYDILFYDSYLDVVPERPVRGLAEHAERGRDPVLHLRHPRLHPADGRDGAAVADAGARIAVARRVRGAGAARPRPTAAPADTTSSGGTNTGLILGVLAVVAVVVVGGLVDVQATERRRRRRRRRRVTRCTAIDWPCSPPIRRRPPRPAPLLGAAAAPA